MSRARLRGISPDVGVARARGLSSGWRVRETESLDPSRLMELGAGGAR